MTRREFVSGAGAAALGVGLIVGVPGKKTGPKWTDVHSDRAMCEVCSKLADEYRMRFAIHNHGHVRCLSDLKNGSSGINPAGRVFDYDGIFAALKEIGYDGWLGLELAAAFPKTPEWIDESRVYFEGLI